jgi:CHAT domain-containing protein
LQYRQKDLAAFKLGDMAARESILRAWAKIDPLEGKWGLFSFLADTKERAEAFRLGQELIQEQRWPPNRVRLRVQLARYYLDDSNLKEAGRLLTEAESIFKNDVSNLPKRGDAAFWSARAEIELFMAKAFYSSRTGRWQEAIESAKIAVDKSTQMSKLMSMAPSENARQWSYGTMLFAYGTLGGQQMAAGMYADAEWTMRDAYQRTKEYGFPESSMHGFYNRVADYYNAVGRFDEGLKFAGMSEKIVKKLGYPEGSPAWLWARIRLNAALIGEDRWKDVLASFEQIDQETQKLGRAPTGLQTQSLLRGYTYLKNGLNEKAQQILEANQRWHVSNFGEDHYFTAINRGLLAAALAKNGQAQKARDEFAHAVRGMTAPESLTGDYVESAIQQKIRRFVLQSYLQLLAQTAQTHQEDAELVFQVAEQLNVSKVQQALAEAAVRSGVTAPGLSEIIRKEQDAKNEIASLTNYISGQSTEDEKHRNPQVVAQMRLRLTEIEKERREYKNQIQKTYPEYFQLIQPKSPNTQDIAKQLQSDELFMAVIPLEDKTYVWAINAQGHVKFHASEMSETEIKNQVALLRKPLDVADLGPRAPKFDVAAAHRLYTALMGPFDQDLSKSRHLIVSTSGHLAQLPFAVLTRSPDAANPSWLIRDVAISHVPTANGWLALKRLSKQNAATEPLLAWGDPSFDPNAVAQVGNANAVRSVAVTRSVDGPKSNIMDAASYVAYSKIPPLPETRDEVMLLAKILDANPKQDLVLGHDATRASVLKHSASGQMAKKRVVVFATHGLLAGDLPMLNQPALAMAATNNSQESPLLTLEDVLGLRLNADWVVLSACNTAGADGKAEEALSGLARGFFYAGGRSLLVTHWAVETVSAMNLTTHTFAAYKENPQIRRAEALRLAMLETMKRPEFTHPTYWAPYALVGEGGR